MELSYLVLLAVVEMKDGEGRQLEVVWQSGVEVIWQSRGRMAEQRS